MARNNTRNSVARIETHSDDAEVAVLGAMMLERGVALKVLPLLQPSSFYREAHRVIYAAMQSLAGRNQPIDIITLNDELRHIGKLGEIGGPHYLSELNMRVPTSANVEHYARIVFERWMVRMMAAAAADIYTAAQSPGADVFEVMELFQREAKRFGLENAGRREFRPMSDLVTNVVADIEQRRIDRASGKVVTIPFGLIDLDRVTGGAERGDLVIVAGRPGMGKTALAMQVLHDNARGGRIGAMASMEMTIPQLIRREICALSGISMIDLRTGKIDDVTMAQVRAAAESLRHPNILLDDEPAMHIDRLRARVRLLAERLRPFGRRIDAVLVDYLQLGVADGHRREEQLAQFSRGLKTLAKDEDLVVIAAASLNRQLEARADKRPTLPDLRESGQIEFDADTVLGIYRPEYYGETMDDDGNSTAGIAELIVLKQRNGPAGITVRVGFDAPRMRFRDLALFLDEQQTRLELMPSVIEKPF